MEFSSLDEIKNEVKSCTKCVLCKTRTNAVPGKGSQNSTIMFVGEAPGRSEDRQGEPFVGIAGQKLSLALEYAGFTRDSVYITNVAKCRPPNNRVPTKEEKEACSNYLESEIKILKPKIICIMGNTSFASLLGGKEITKNRGKIIRKDGKTYFLTIHPAATIYNQELIEVLKTDLKKLSELIHEVK